LLHLIPVALLGAILLGFVIRDLFQGPAASAPGGPSGQPAEFAQEPVELDPTPRIQLDFETDPPTMSFGIVTRPGGQRLTFHKKGITNNACLRVDGNEVLFGSKDHGRWAQFYEKEWRDSDGGEHKGGRSVWVLSSPAIKVTQMVEIVPGRVVREKETKKLKRLMDTCLVRYEITNEDRDEHRVGLRFLLDTLIGENDGVPFLFPDGASGCDTMKVFTGPEVPEYLLAIENDLESSKGQSPGTVAKIQFSLGSRFSPPSRVVLGAWPDPRLQQFGHSTARGRFTLWDVPEASMKEVVRAKPPGKPDSAVTIYWSPQPLRPGQTREVGLTYGLGSIASEETGGQLGLIGAERARVNQEFTLQAVVRNPAAGQTVTLEVPDGLALVEESKRTQDAPPVAAGAARPESTVTWRLKGARTGAYTLTVRSSTNLSQSRMVLIEPGTNRDFWDR
jgi:hypothetical protein